MELAIGSARLAQNEHKKAGQAVKFSTREDIEAPIEHVWAHVADFGHFEKQAMRRGADVQRTDSQRAHGLGSEWTVKFTFRGKLREIDAKVVEFDAPNVIALNGVSGGLHGDTRVELVALSPGARV